MPGKFASSGPTIRPIAQADWPAAWEIIEPVFRSGETCVYSPDITEEEAFRLWVQVPDVTFVAIDDREEILGTYYLKPNQPGLGSHVCNCGYLVSDRARGKGIASAMCLHSQDEAVAPGFRAMQFNFVVASNENAIRLWETHGFRVVGTLPSAFRHPKLGFIDAVVMFKSLAGDLDSIPS